MAVTGSAGVLGSPVTLGIALAYLAFALAIVLTWRVPQLEVYVPRWLFNFMYPIDKINLDVLRLAHFLALAVVTVWLVPRDWSGFRSPLLRPAVVCGQHSLPIFCLGIFLSFAGHFIITEKAGGPLMQVLVSLSGLGIMTVTAFLLRWYQDMEKRVAAYRPMLPDADIAGGDV